MADVNLGTARGEIVIGSDTKGAKQAEAALLGTNKAAAQAGTAVATAGKIAGGAGLAIAAGMALAVNSAANFEQRMSAVKAVSGASGSEMKSLSALALQLGKDTSFSATEAASAIEELVKAGVSVPDVMNGAAQATVALAAAGEVSLPQAATIASNAMNAFGLSAAQMPKVADLIAGAANASAIDVGEFGQSLQQVGAVAHLAGIGFDDTATAIALLGNAGIKGSDAGTSLKTMFQRLIPQTDKQKALMEQLGLITKDGANQFFDASGKVKSLSDVSQVLQNSLKGMTKEQKLATLGTLFGSDAIRGAAIVADAGAKGFDKMAASMGKVTAADVAKTRLDNFKGSLEQLKGSVETAGIVIGQVLLPALRKIVDAVTGVLNKFLSLNPATQQLILTIVGIVGASLLFVAAALKIGMVIKSLTSYIKLAGGAMKALQLVFAASPFGFVLIGIGLLIAGLILAYKHSATFRNIVNQLAVVLGGVLAAAFNTAKAAIAAIQPILAAVGNILSTKVWPVIQQVASALMGQLRAGFTVVMAAVQTLMPTLRQFGAAVSGAATSVGGVLVPILKTVGSFILGTFLPIFIRLIGFFGGIFIQTIVRVFTGIVSIIKGAIQIITGIINVFRGVFTGNWRLAWKGVQQITSGVINVIKGLVKVFTAGIVSTVKAMLGVLKSIWSAAWNAIKSLASNVWRAIVSAIRNYVNNIKSEIRNGINGAKSLWSSGLNAIKSAAASIFNAIVSTVRGKINDFMSAVRGIKGKITGAFSGAGSWLVGAGRSIISGLARGVTAAGQKVIDAARRVVAKVKALLPGSPVKEGPLTSLNHGHAGKEIVRMIAGGITDERGTLERAMRGLAGNTIQAGIAGTLAPSSIPAFAAQPAPGPSGPHIENLTVTIPAKDLDEMRTVQQFFGRVQQEARRMNPRLRTVG